LHDLLTREIGARWPHFFVEDWRPLTVVLDKGELRPAVCGPRSRPKANLASGCRTSLASMGQTGYRHGRTEESWEVLWRSTGTGLEQRPPTTRR